MCTGGDGPSGGIGADGMGAASVGQANNAEPGAASIGAAQGEATGSGGLGGGPGAGKGDNSGAGGGFGGSAVGGTTDTSGSFGGLGAVGAPGTIGGIESGTALGTSYSGVAPDTMSTDIDSDMAAALGPTDTDMASAMSGVTDLAGTNLGTTAQAVGPMSQLGQVASMLSSLVGKVPGLGPVGKLGQMGINSLEGRTNTMSLDPRDLAMAGIMSVVDPLGLTSGRYGPATADDAAEYGGSLGPGGIGSASTRS